MCGKLGTLAWLSSSTHEMPSPVTTYIIFENLYFLVANIFYAIKTYLLVPYISSIGWQFIKNFLLICWSGKSLATHQSKHKVELLGI